MKRLGIILYLCSLNTIIGCSNHFMPMEDYFVAFELNMPATSPRSVIQGALCLPDRSVCGRRKVDMDLYDPDDVTIDYEDSNYPNGFLSSGYSDEQMEAGVFWNDALELGPETLHGVRFNDLPSVFLDIAPRFHLSAPAKDTEFSLASLSNVRVEWEPKNEDFPVQWKLFPVDNEAEDLSCDTLAWASFEGEGDDAGFLDIPVGVFPPNLPLEGCLVAIRIARIKSFGLPDGAVNGQIRSRVTDGVIFRIVP